MLDSLVALSISIVLFHAGTATIIVMNDVILP
jgi:hypothetical protein